MIKPTVASNSELQDHIQRTLAQGVHGFNLASLSWSGAIIMSEVDCPTGWTRLSAMDNKFPRGAAAAGTTGGADTHKHTVTIGASWTATSGGWVLPEAAIYDTSADSNIPAYRTVIFCKKD